MGKIDFIYIPVGIFFIVSIKSGNYFALSKVRYLRFQTRIFEFFNFDRHIKFCTF